MRGLRRPETTVRIDGLRLEYWPVSAISGRSAGDFGSGAAGAADVLRGLGFVVRDVRDAEAW
jgi:hypothetical protein